MFGSVNSIYSVTMLSALELIKNFIFKQCFTDCAFARRETLLRAHKLHVRRDRAGLGEGIIHNNLLTCHANRTVWTEMNR